MKATTRLIGLAVGAAILVACAMYGDKIDEYTGTTRADRCADLTAGVAIYDALLEQRKAAFEADPDSTMPSLTEAEQSARVVAQVLLDNCNAKLAAEAAAAE